MKRWQCVICGFVYDECVGYAEGGIALGTPWDGVPAHWVCPDCGTSKGDFEMVCPDRDQTLQTKPDQVAIHLADDRDRPICDVRMFTLAVKERALVWSGS